MWRCSNVRRLYRRGGGFLAAFLLGGIVGAALGILFAPRPGRETREIIATRAGEYWDQGVEMYETRRRQGLRALRQGKAKVAQTSDQVREQIDTARARLAEQVEKNAPAAKEAVGKAADTRSAASTPLPTRRARASTTRRRRSPSRPTRPSRPCPRSRTHRERGGPGSTAGGARVRYNEARHARAGVLTDAGPMVCVEEASVRSFKEVDGLPVIVPGRKKPSEWAG